MWGLKLEMAQDWFTQSIESPIRLCGSTFSVSCGVCTHTQCSQWTWSPPPSEIDLWGNENIIGQCFQFEMDENTPTMHDWMNVNCSTEWPRSLCLSFSSFVHLGTQTGDGAYCRAPFTSAWSSRHVPTWRHLHAPRCSWGWPECGDQALLGRPSPCKGN